jgi:hypothetical protein
MDNQTNEKPGAQPITQEKHHRKGWPAFAKDLPRWRIIPNPDFQLIPPDRLAQKLRDVDAAVADSIREDIQYLDKELLRLFRERDTEAKVNQNRYRQFQIIYIILALAATVIGGLQGLASTHHSWLAWAAFAETVVALSATFVAALSGNDPPLPRWISNRRKTEGMRQEYFRYLMHAAPYDLEDAAHRELLLAQRAAEINRGNYPDTKQSAGGTQ